MLRCPVESTFALSLAQLHQACFKEAWSVEAFTSLLQLPTTVFYLDDTSFLICTHVLDEMEILSIGVVPQARCQGRAMHLMQILFEYADKWHVSRIFLEVAENNIAALHLYLKNGFKPNGRRVGYYVHSDGIQDALCLVWTQKKDS